MKFGKLFGFLLVLLCGSFVARAQFGVYGMYQGTQLSGIQCFAPSGTTCSASNGKVNPSGGTLGVFYDLRSFGPIRLGADVRGSIMRANKSAASTAGGKNITGADSILGGVRASIKTPLPWLKPYVQGSVGYARSNAPEPPSGNQNVTPPIYDDFIQYQGYAGADIRIFPILDFRVIEVGMGAMNRFGTGLGTSNITVKSIGAGVVLHFPSK